MNKEYVMLDELHLTTPTKHIKDTLNLNNIREVHIPKFYRNLGLSGLYIAATIIAIECLTSIALPHAYVFLDIIMPYAFRICLIYTAVSGITAGILILYTRKQKVEYQCAIVKCTNSIEQDGVYSYEFSIKKNLALICSSTDFEVIASDINVNDKYIIAKDSITEQYMICNANLD